MSWLGEGVPSQLVSRGMVVPNTTSTNHKLAKGMLILAARSNTSLRGVETSPQILGPTKITSQNRERKKRRTIYFVPTTRFEAQKSPPKPSSTSDTALSARKPRRNRAKTAPNSRHWRASRCQKPRLGPVGPVEHTEEEVLQPRRASSVRRSARSRPKEGGGARQRR